MSAEQGDRVGQIEVDAKLFGRAEAWGKVCGSCDAGLPMSCTHPDEDPRTVIADLLDAVQQQTRIAASLEADLARILNAWDTYRDSLWAPSMIKKAIEAARERSIR